jgi:hypothetical protein
MTTAAETFVTNGIAALNPLPGSACWTAVFAAKANFVKTATDNALACVTNMINTTSNDLALMESMQTEINSVMQTGQLNFSLMTDITTGSASITSDIASAKEKFIACQIAGIASSISTLAPIAAASASCAFFG